MSMTHFFERENLFRPVGERISIEAAIAARGMKKENLWIGQLTKLGRRAVFENDLRFIFALAELEAKPYVKLYQFDRGKIDGYLASYGVSDCDAAEVDFVVTLQSGEEQWWRVAEARPTKPTAHDSALTLAAKRCGAAYFLKTLKDISPWEIRFHNWLDLSQAMVSTRFLNCSRQMCEVNSLLCAHGKITYGQLLRSIDGDPALTRGAVARLIQAGRASVDLDAALLSPGSAISLSGAACNSASLPQDNEAQPNGGGVKWYATGAVDLNPERNGGDVPPVDTLPRKGRPRNIVTPDTPPPESWPPLVIDGVKQDHRTIESRKTAVELYARNADADLITSSTGLSIPDARRLYKRCIATDEHGRMYGFNGLLPYNHVKAYTRTKEVVQRLSDGSTGGAGKMGKHLRDWPESEEFIRKQLFPDDPNDIPTSDPISNLHKNWLTELRRLGLSASDWPFGSKTEGLQAYSQFRKKLIKQRLGTGGPPIGYQPLIRALRPLSFMQLDYKKTDCASVLRIENKYHQTFRVPVRRWYKGFMCCEVTTAVTGLNTLFEIEPSCDCGLETVLSALDPSTDVFNLAADSPTCDRKFLLRHFVPELAWNGWLVLRVDNGVVNRAHDFIHNTIDTIGCWIQFGPKYYWPARHQIERTLGIINRAGEIRMPSSYGSSPGDPRRNAPEQAAIELEIRASEVMKITEDATGQVNAAGSEANEGSSRVNAVKAALSHPDVGVSLRPLPKTTQLDHHLLGHYERRMVHRDHKGMYVKIDRSLYRNVKLSERSDLLNKWVYAYVGRTDAKFARAFVEGTGDDLGILKGYGGYCQRVIPWTYRKLVERGIGDSGEHIGPDGVETWKQEKASSLTKGKRKRSRQSGEANRLASLERREELASTRPTDGTDDEARSSADGDSLTKTDKAKLPSQIQVDGASMASDPFGINRIPV
jgi:putative transposase